MIPNIVIDSCVLYSAQLRDIFLQLHTQKNINIYWTNRIHEEWVSKLIRNRKDLNESKIKQIPHLLNRYFPESLVLEDESIINSLQLPDEKDRHVLAAAIKCHADIIVTINIKDFPEQCLKPYGISGQNPNQIFKHFIESSPNEILNAIKIITNRLKSPPISIEQYINNLDLVLQIELASFLRENQFQT